MIDEKVLIEHIKHHKETVYPSHAMAAAIYELAHDHFIDMVNIQPKVGGWIPCSSGNFPTREVLVCKEDGTIDFDVFDLMHEDWKFNSNHHKNKVIAWMPLPEPYDANTEAEKPQWQQQMMGRFMKGE